MSAAVGILPLPLGGGGRGWGEPPRVQNKAQEIWTAGALAGTALALPTRAGAFSIRPMPARAPAVHNLHELSNVALHPTPLPPPLKRRGR